MNEFKHFFVGRWVPVLLVFTHIPEERDSLKELFLNCGRD